MAWVTSNADEPMSRPRPDPLSEKGTAVEDVDPTGMFNDAVDAKANPFDVHATVSVTL